MLLLFLARYVVLTGGRSIVRGLLQASDFVSPASPEAWQQPPPTSRVGHFPTANCLWLELGSTDIKCWLQWIIDITINQNGDNYFCFEYYQFSVLEWRFVALHTFYKSICGLVHWLNFLLVVMLAKVRWFGCRCLSEPKTIYLKKNNLYNAINWLSRRRWSKPERYV